MSNNVVARSIAENLVGTKKALEGDSSADFFWDSKYLPLEEVESYLHVACRERGIKLTFDMTAGESLYFKTLNYTTYAGFLIIHPLSPEQSMRQMYDAYADNVKAVGHVDYLKSIIKETGNFSKYVIKDQAKPKENRNTLLVLPGGNKLKKHCCIGMIKKVINERGPKNVTLKIHPISFLQIYHELKSHLDSDVILSDSNEDLFQCMTQADYIYTTMCSESALVAHLLDKDVYHFDLFQNREAAPFIHINYFLFSTVDPLAWVDRTFSSPKSGVIHPSVDKAWKSKVDSYLDYILQLRSFYKEAYVYTE